MSTLRPGLRPRPLREAPDLPGVTLIQGDGGVAVGGITHDSRQVQVGDIYAALTGFTTHGGEFAGRAAEAGAVAILTDDAGADRATATGLPVLLAEDVRHAMGELAAWVYDRPAESMLMIGVTGTNGKTTTSYLLDAALRAAGHVTGVIGTVGTVIGDEVVPTVRTTPESTDVHALLAVMRERGVTAVSMEVSSHALVLGRVDGIVFDVAVFTNLTQDHLDFHGTLEAYFAAKASLFVTARSRQGVVCVDDDWGVRLAGSATVPVTTYAGEPRTGSEADWTAHDVDPGTAAGSSARITGPAGEVLALRSPLPGTFNLANALGAFVTLHQAGIDDEVVLAGLGAARGVPGRLERIDVPGAPCEAFVDYAHTPDAVARVLATARSFTPGRVVVVLGCGGDRDRDKRTVMGARAAELADVVIVTDDNPRTEPPGVIRGTVLAGARAVVSPRATRILEVGDRRSAVQQAVAQAGPGDVVLVLGKGHETGQEVAGVVHPFDDREVVRAALTEVAR